LRKHVSLSVPLFPENYTDAFFTYACRAHEIGGLDLVVDEGIAAIMIDKDSLIPSKDELIKETDDLVNQLVCLLGRQLSMLLERFIARDRQQKTRDFKRRQY
jgi:hypothetical protein